MLFLPQIIVRIVMTHSLIADYRRLAPIVK